MTVNCANDAGSNGTSDCDLRRPVAPMNPAAEFAPSGPIVFGGTFNPVHLGHLRAAEEIAEQLRASRVLFVPSHAPPHKSDDPRDPLASADQRRRWLAAALAGNPRFELETLELERGGPSYSVDTLAALAERFAPARPVFAIGQDAFVELGAWRQPRLIARLAHLAVLQRPPGDGGSLAQWLPSCLREDFTLAADGRSSRHREAGTWIRVFDVAALDISASTIRARLRAGRSVRYLLPEAIHDEVVACGFYAPRADSRP